MDTQKLYLINWNFKIEKNSNDSYLCIGKHTSGNSILLTGIEPEKLIEKIKRYAEQIESEMENQKQKQY